MDNNNTRQNNKYVVYKNDLKYRKHRNLDKNKILFNDEITRELYDTDLDSIDYRMKECIESGCITLDLKHMDLTDNTFPKISTTISKKLKYLFMSDNNLTKIPDFVIMFPCLEVIDISYNNISRVDDIPVTLNELCIRDNPLSYFKINKICSSLKIIDCSNCLLREIANNFTNLEILICSNNKLTSINNHCNLKKLICNSNKISHISDCVKLEYLDCNDNNILNNLSDDMIRLEHIVCSNTSINKLPYKSPLKTVESFNNKISELQYIPTLKEFLCNNDQLKLISEKYKIESITEHKKKFLCIMFK